MLYASAMLQLVLHLKRRAQVPARGHLFMQGEQQTQVAVSNLRSNGLVVLYNTDKRTFLNAYVQQRSFCRMAVYISTADLASFFFNWIRIYGLDLPGITYEFLMGKFAILIGPEERLVRGIYGCRDFDTHEKVAAIVENASSSSPCKTEAMANLRSNVRALEGLRAGRGKNSSRTA